MIFEREAPWLLGGAYRIVGERDLADDVIQYAFLQIWKEAHSFDPNRGSAPGWIYSVVRNRVLKFRRARFRHRAMDDRVLLAIFERRPTTTTRFCDGGKIVGNKVRAAGLIS